MDMLSRHAARAALLAWAGLVSAPCSASDAAPAPAPRAAADEGMPGYAERVMNAVNAYRIEKGLPALVQTPELAALAAEHSRDMAGRKRPSHEGFAQRFDRTGAELCVENVAHGFRVPEQVLAGWRRVTTHHRNLLEPRVRYVGMASSGLYVTYFACDTPR